MVLEPKPVSMVLASLKLHGTHISKSASTQNLHEVIVVAGGVVLPISPLLHTMHSVHTAFSSLTAHATIEQIARQGAEPPHALFFRLIESLA